jgi:hypothetical protein
MNHFISKKYSASIFEADPGKESSTFHPNGGTRLQDLHRGDFNINVNHHEYGR